MFERIKNYLHRRNILNAQTAFINRGESNHTKFLSEFQRVSFMADGEIRDEYAYNAHRYIDGLEFHHRTEFTLWRYNATSMVYAIGLCGRLTLKPNQGVVQMRRYRKEEEVTRFFLPLFDDSKFSIELFPLQNNAVFLKELQTKGTDGVLTHLNVVDFREPEKSMRGTLLHYTENAIHRLLPFDDYAIIVTVDKYALEEDNELTEARLRLIAVDRILDEKYIVKGEFRRAFQSYNDEIFRSLLKDNITEMENTYLAFQKEQETQ